MRLQAYRIEGVSHFINESALIRQQHTVRLSFPRPWQVRPGDIIRELLHGVVGEKHIYGAFGIVLWVIDGNALGAVGILWSNQKVNPWDPSF